jgi:hypothetical protein
MVRTIEQPPESSTVLAPSHGLESHRRGVFGAEYMTERILQLLTGRLWIRDTTTGENFRRATLADVVKCKGRGPHPIDGRWCGFDMADSPGFAFGSPGMEDLLAKTIGVKPW